MKARIWVAALFLGLVSAGTAMAGAFEDATAAYEKGDFAGAYMLLRPLAEQGDASAQFNLGLLYDKGQGVMQDFGLAAQWYRRSADQGFAVAQASLAFLYANGHGVPRSLVDAYLWFSLAAAQGNENARMNKERAASLMSPADLAAADKLVKQWKAVPPRPVERQI